MIGTNQLKNGMAIVLDGTLYLVLEFQHVKPGKGGAFVRTRLKNLNSGGILDKTFRAGEKIEDAFIESRPLQFLYATGSSYNFMDQETYEQYVIEADQLGDVTKYLKEGIEIVGDFYKDALISATPPITVELSVAETEPGFRGDTAKGGTKQAVLETGAVVQVPLFIEPGTVLKIDTRTGDYISRAQ